MTDFQLTPWYLRLLGFKKYRRKEFFSALIIFRDVGTKWFYYSEEEKLKIDKNI